MAQLFYLSGQQLSDGTGAPYVAAKAYFYVTGTTTPLATYSDAGLTAVNANPVVADANGRFGDVYLQASRYKVVLTTSADVAIDTLDPVDATLQLVQSATAPANPYPFMVYHNTSDGNRYRRNAAGTAWINEGPVDSLIAAASVSEMLVGTETAKSATPDSVAGIWQRGSDIASASTLSLPATGGGVFTVTGTTTVTGISTAQGGRCVKLRFAGSLTLTHNGTSFILPGGANIQTSAGDCAEFINDAATDASGSNWRCFNYQRASGSPNTITDFLADQATMEAASSTTTFVSPGNANFHPGVAKAWIFWNATGTPAINANLNVTSITDNGTGDQTVNLTTAFSSVNYNVAQSGSDNPATTNWNLVKPYSSGTRLAASYRCYMMFGNFGTSNVVDLDSANLTFFGAQ